jgi:hypothetical protein
MGLTVFGVAASFFIDCDPIVLLSKLPSPRDRMAQDVTSVTSDREALSSPSRSCIFVFAMSKTFTSNALQRRDAP